jgi:hypothetical protein
MKSKLIYAGAVLVMAFAAAGGATSHKATIKTLMQEDANGDYRLFIFGSDRILVCEEKPIKLISQGDSINPIVIECRH